MRPACLLLLVACGGGDPALAPGSASLPGIWTGANAAAELDLVMANTDLGNACMPFLLPQYATTIQLTGTYHDLRTGESASHECFHRRVAPHPVLDLLRQSVTASGDRDHQRRQ
jgi:hypothetical protein